MSYRFLALRAIRTRTVLIAAMVFAIGCITAASLLTVRRQMERQILNDLSANLSRSVQGFHRLQADHLANQQRTCRLLADLPSLKALMTTSDPRTIRDGATEFWKTSGSDLFALATRDGSVVASFTKETPASPALSGSLQNLLQAPERYEVIEGGRLFAVAVQPIVFGPAVSGTVLGYVYTGFAINQAFVAQLSEASAVDVSFIASSQVLATSLPPGLRPRLPAALPKSPGNVAELRKMVLGSTRYLTAVEDLSPLAQGPLLLVLMHSFRGAEQAAHQIDTLLLLVGLVATFAGAALMVFLAKLVTQPLESLAKDVSAFGCGQVNMAAQAGTAEVNALSAAFQSMREKIVKSNAALLDSERLATIGQMASSVSHDLRHYLAAIYANAEFLADPGLSEVERKELYADVRSAVVGTTELIDSLLLFSRPGRKAQPQLLNVNDVMQKARALVEVHPDAADVRVDVHWAESNAMCVRADPRQMERVLVNLLLNACQVDRPSGVQPRVELAIREETPFVVFSIVDNGMGVAASERSPCTAAFLDKRSSSSGCLCKKR